MQRTADIRRVGIALVFAFGVAAPRIAEAQAEPSGGFDVTAWDTILATYTTRDGGFRYAALRGNSAHRQLLADFVRRVGEAAPAGWARTEQLAFYINAYNALTISSVLELWPVSSVRAEEGFFDRRQHRVAGQQMTLDHLETRIIRARFHEPRIHFLVNCASVGCPPLAPTAITSESLGRALEAQARSFVRATTRVDRGGGRARLSQIFEWFAEDFGGPEGVREFVASRLGADDATFVRAPATRVESYPYDWALNARP